MDDEIQRKKGNIGSFFYIPIGYMLLLFSLWETDDWMVKYRKKNISMLFLFVYYSLQWANFIFQFGTLLWSKTGQKKEDYIYITCFSSPGWIHALWMIRIMALIPLFLSLSLLFALACFIYFPEKKKRNTNGFFQIFFILRLVVSRSRQKSTRRI